jgi:two-component system, LytTR family, sensor kinase
MGSQFKNIFSTKVYVHIIVWLLIFSLPNLLSYRNFENLTEKEALVASQFFRLGLVAYCYWVVIFYLAVYWLTPKFFYTKKYVEGLFVVTLAFAILMVFHSYIFKFIITTRDFHWNKSIVHHFPAYLLAIVSGMLYKVTNDQLTEDRIKHDKEEENMKTELSFLRSQISPHFLFNVLNNIVALVRLKSDELEPTIMKLSSLMRYMLYDTNENKVPITKEIQYLQSYIDLQIQRFGNKVKLNISIQVLDENVDIEPMLLIPFVENAFKHGIGNLPNPEIDIDIKVANGTLTFFVKNKVDKSNIDDKDKTNGIGLNNVGRRLNLLYKIKHDLKIVNENGFYLVTLFLNFNE